MSYKPVLKLDWCTHEAAKHAVLNWHYSQAMPSGKLAKIGVWEDGRFIGVVIYGSGATANIGKPYGLQQTEICELVRVALREHQAPVSRILAISLKLLRQQFKGLRLVVSYSDLNQHHHGGIYQANGWLYTGRAQDTGGSLILKGKKVHGQTVGSVYGTRSIEWLRKHVDPNCCLAPTAGKHRYLMPLDETMRQKVSHLAKPYPKRVTSIDGDAMPPSIESGSIPTVTLQS